jgi:hypothetical protein
VHDAKVRSFSQNVHWYRLQSPQPHTASRSAPCPQPHDTPKSEPKSDGAVIAQRTSVSCAPIARHNTAAEAVEQALEDLGLPADLVAEIEGRLGV